jgi:hypothetical protein
MDICEVAYARLAFPMAPAIRITRFATPPAPTGRKCPLVELSDQPGDVVEVT